MTKVRECRGVLLEPQNHNREDFLKFISSLALEVHVEASLSNIEDPSTVAIQVSVCYDHVSRPHDWMSRVSAEWHVIECYGCQVM